mmetsp:Transcript_5614/g.20216  ORF Transcript_5614/g.20216 Transcript_5614/m.20216 type:complete len:205 (+) Transcript_5614:1735-2349(+)
MVLELPQQKLRPRRVEELCTRHRRGAHALVQGPVAGVPERLEDHAHGNEELLPVHREREVDLAALKVEEPHRDGGHVPPAAPHEDAIVRVVGAPLLERAPADGHHVIPPLHQDQAHEPLISIAHEVAAELVGLLARLDERLLSQVAQVAQLALHHDRHPAQVLAEPLRLAVVHLDHDVDKHVTAVGGPADPAVPWEFSELHPLR